MRPAASEMPEHFGKKSCRTRQINQQVTGSHCKKFLDKYGPHAKAYPG